MYRVLLLGAGHSRELRINLGHDPAPFVITIDCNPEVCPDVVHDLDNAPWPVKAGKFDEVHAYEVLEHLGRQGNAKAFFKTFTEIWHALKPGGYLCGTCPSARSVWAWGDPGHTRIIAPASLVFLDQTQYTRQLDGERVTSMSDYRSIYFADFRPIRSDDDGETHAFVLQAVKPSRRHAPEPNFT